MRRAVEGIVVGIFLLLPLWQLVAGEGGETVPPVVINEIMWGGDAYIELYNTTEADMPLEGWSLTTESKYNNERMIVDFDEHDAIGPFEYFLIGEHEWVEDFENSKVVHPLSFVTVSGEMLRLYDASGSIVDSANEVGEVWFGGGCMDGGVAMERKEGGFHDGTVSSSWHSSSAFEHGRHGTPGSANSEGDGEGMFVPCPLPAEEVVINEFIPFPKGPDATDEFIELKNISNETIDISGWQLGNRIGGSPLYTIPPGTVMEPGELLVFWRPETKIVLRNDQDAVRLLRTDGSVASAFSYSGVKNGHSYNWLADGTYALSDTPTPGQENIISGHDDHLPAPSPAPSVTPTPPVLLGPFLEGVVINEFIPFPKGPDATDEFIELKNISNETIDISGWQLGNRIGGSSLYTIPPGTVMEPGELLVFWRPETKIVLRNDQDAVRLLHPDGNTVSLFSYNIVVRGASYNRLADGSYVLSSIPTPGEENIIADPFSPDSQETGGAGGLLAEPLSLPISLLRQQPQGSLVEFTGTVSAPPGTLGVGILYVSGSGMQVYLSGAGYPPLALGDVVRVTGVLAQVGGEARVRLRQASDIAVVSSGAAPQAKPVQTGEISEPLEGSLVDIQGAVTRSSGATFYIDDGSGEVRIFVNSHTGINKPTTRQGNIVRITGIVSRTQSGYRVLPRFQEDIVIVSAGAPSVARSSLAAKSGLAGALSAGISERILPLDVFVSDHLRSMAQSQGAYRLPSREAKRQAFAVFGLGMAAMQAFGAAAHKEPLWRKR